MPPEKVDFHILGSGLASIMTEYILRVVAPHYCAGAIFIDGKCVKAAPIIKWMVGKPPQETKRYLLKKGYKYEWIKC